MKKIRPKHSPLSLRTFWFITFLFLLNSSYGQLIIKTNRTVNDLVQNVLANKGVVIPPTSIEFSSNLNAIAFFDGRNSNLGIDSGILLSTGRTINAIGPNLLGNTGTSNNSPGDSDITSLNPNDANYDAAWISFTVIPESDNISFKFVFASEEYPEFVNKTYNDLFGLFIEGQGFPTRTNLALIPGTSTPISIQNVNHLTNSQFYRDNTGGASISFDGFTTIIEANAKVVPCTPYSLKFVIADIIDLIYDSGIFIEAQSLKSLSDNAISVNFQQEIFTECDSNLISFSRNSDNLSNPITVDFEIYGTAKLGNDFYLTATNQVIIPAGAKSAVSTITPVTDGVSEPSETILVKILNPVECDTIFKTAILLDYKKFDSVEYKIVCSSSSAVVTILNYDLLDSIGWSNENNILVGTGPLITIQKTDTGYFYIRAVEKCTNRVIIDSLKLKFYDVTISGDSIVCFGDTLRFNVNSNLSNAKYEWTSTTGGSFFPSPFSTSPYIVPDKSGYVTVSITNDGICGIQTHKVQVVKLDVELDTINICGLGNSSQLKATGGTKYKWTPNLYLDNDTIANPIVTPDSNITYTVNISNGTCNDNFEVSVRIDSIIKVETIDDIYICSRQFANLSAVGSPTNTYYWTPIKDLDNPNSPNPKANPVSTTTYYVVGYNGSCTSVDSVIVYVVNPVESNMSYTFDSCSKTFIANQIDASDSTDVIWDMGNGDTVSGPYIYYQYKNPGYYNIKSILNRQAPCIDSEIIQVYMPAVDVAKRRIPEAFSPNGDGINDEFKVFFGNLPCAVESFKIFNRWGQLVYDYKSRDELSWDGKLNGELCPAGVYVYFIKGEGFQDTGWVALIR